mgnify:CR=1 FL=1
MRHGFVLVALSGLLWASPVQAGDACSARRDFAYSVALRYQQGEATSTIARGVSDLSRRVIIGSLYGEPRYRTKPYQKKAAERFAAVKSAEVCRQIHLKH